jgi:hypothetical protein
MTPQERQLVADLFDRLEQLEQTPRDPQAEAAIAEGQRRAPHAVYALVQTALVQDEALRRADARIRELEDALGHDRAEDPRDRGFLDNMRDALFGDREQPRGSVPPTGDRPWGTRPGGDRPMGVPPGFGSRDAGPPPLPPQPEPGRGGSFLGTAAAAAAGVIGGSLLLGGIRNAWGQAPQSEKTGAFDADAGGGARNPWGGESSGGGDLAQQAGLQDMGRGGHAPQDAGGEHFGLFNGGDDTNLDQDPDVDFDPGDGGDIL